MSEYTAKQVRIFIDKNKLKRLNELSGDQTLTAQMDEIISEYIKAAETGKEKRDEERA